MTMGQAVAAGADAFFDEKYGETVRTVRVEGFSHELCGGTHCRASGQIGGFVITGERSIGSGMRRIEAVTGEAAEALVDGRLATLDAAAAAAGVQTPDALPARVAELQERIRELEKRLQGRAPGGGMPRPATSPGPRSASAISRWSRTPGPFPSMDEVKGYAKDDPWHAAQRRHRGRPRRCGAAAVRDRERGPGGPRASARGTWCARGVAAIDGKGGGRPEMAQGRGTRRDGLPAALAAIRERLAGWAG